MRELLHNAWNGWLDYLEAGKVIALFLIALFLCPFFPLQEERKRDMAYYCAVMTILCIFPVSAMLLMCYQTRFYDYEWIWTLVPMTAMIACMEVLVLEWCQKKDGWKSKSVATVVTTIAILSLLCSGLGNERWRVENLREERQKVKAVLHDVVRQSDESICLWGPEEIITHARGLDGSIQLLYGRNLYQKHLDAYSYDVYTRDLRELYIWMAMAERYGTIQVPVAGDLACAEDGFYRGDVINGIECIEKALELGVNRILLPGSMKQEEMEKVLNAYAFKCVPLEGYYLLMRVEEERD